MKALLKTEQLRRQEQAILDISKEADERNRLGQYPTPPQLALDISQLAYEYCKNIGNKIHFLEPGFGTGAFYSALVQVLPKTKIGSAFGIELDPQFCLFAQT
jgi:adenine-specific DNA-methyltransferase